MKKPITILFLLLYLVSTIGINVAIHTCGGDSEALLVTSEAKDPCGDGMPMEDMCCTTELKTSKINDDQLGTFNQVAVHLSVVDVLPVESASTNTEQNATLALQSVTDTSPPKVDLQIFNSVFLI